MLMMVIRLKPSATITMPSDIEREAGAEPPRCHGRRVACRRRRVLSAFDHRHALAVQHLELLRTLPHGHQDHEDPGKHAGHEDKGEKFIGLHWGSCPLTGEIRLGRQSDCFSGFRATRTLRR